jgi:hypothetical protein
VYRIALAQLAKDISAYSIVADLSIFESAQFWDSERNSEASTGTRTNNKRQTTNRGIEFA